MSGAISRPVQPLRAFPIVSRVGAGATLHLITDDAHEPHLKPGEWAVIDTNDREPEYGELFLFAPGVIFSGLSLRCIMHPPKGVRIVGDEECAWLVSLQRAHSLEEALRMRVAGRTVHSDGPIPVFTLAPEIIGRCVAIFERPARPTS